MAQRSSPSASATYVPPLPASSQQTARPPHPRPPQPTPVCWTYISLLDLLLYYYNTAQLAAMILLLLHCDSPIEMILSSHLRHPHRPGHSSNPGSAALLLLHSTAGCDDSTATALRFSHRNHINSLNVESHSAGRFLLSTKLACFCVSKRK